MKEVLNTKRKVSVRVRGRQVHTYFVWTGAIQGWGKRNAVPFATQLRYSISKYFCPYTRTMGTAFLLKKNLPKVNR